MKVISMNLVNGAVTEYENFPFTSYANVGGRVFAAGAGGLVEITGKLDDANPIHASVKFGKLDGGDNRLKHAPCAYVEARTANELTFHVHSEDGTDWEYPLEDDTEVLATHRATIGRGLVSKRWQFGISGPADFEIVEVFVPLYVSERRI